MERNGNVDTIFRQCRQADFAAHSSDAERYEKIIAQSSGGSVIGVNRTAIRREKRIGGWDSARLAILTAGARNKEETGCYVSTPASFVIF
jgi:hypothetical protein